MGSEITSPVGRVRNWRDRFETAASVNKRRASVRLPNHHDDAATCRILSLPDGAAVYGIWCLLAGALSRHGPGRDGWLTHDGSPGGAPWTLDDLAVRWRRPVSEIARAFQVLSSPDIGWLEGISTQSVAPVAPATPAKADVPQDAPLFDQFWQLWPTHRRKVARAQCLASWRSRGFEKIGLSIIDGLKRWISSADWNKDGGEYIPMPATWLNQRRWEAPENPAQATTLDDQASPDWKPRRPGLHEFDDILGHHPSRVE